MSWYYIYKACVLSKEDNKIRPLGPFNSAGRWCHILEKSRSFASNLHESFIKIEEEQMSDELYEIFRKQYDLASIEETKETIKSEYPLSYLPLKNLPTGSFIKRGYFLIDEIDRYEKSIVDDEIYFDEFSDPLTVAEYDRRMQNELKFGKPGEVEDIDGYKYTPHSCSEYFYYAYPDYLSKEYESFIIREACDMLTNDELNIDKEKEEIVILLEQG